MRTGIILAAGMASRFSGVYKDLLPTDSGPGDMNCVIDHGFAALSHWGADRYIVTTNPTKIHEHTRHFGRRKFAANTIALVPMYSGEMFNSLQSALSFASERNAMVMADTIFNYDAIPVNITAPLSFGVFRTYEPERFSVFYTNDRQQTYLVTKPVNLKGEFKAWGCVLFNLEVAEYWRGLSPDLPYDEAFNLAMNRYGYATFDLEYYYDLANFEKYREYVNSIR